MTSRPARFDTRVPPSRCAALVTLLILALPCWLVNAQEGVTRIVFASGPEATGTVPRLIARFNAEHEDRIEVTWREMDRDNSVHHQQLVADFESGSAGPHVIASDVIWTAEFARNEWVDDVTRGFYEDFYRPDFLPAALKSATYRMRIWGVPWYTDASLLFYRKDLLAASGFDAAPETWDELIQVARRVMANSGIPHGFVFQGAEYEGGTANAVEYIWSAGGEVMHGEIRVVTPLGGRVTEYDSVTIDSAEAAAGLNVARRLIAEGAAPAEVTSFREQEALAAFLAGDAVFLRSWPYVQGMLGGSRLDATQVGVALLPGISKEHAGVSCLGGWNLMVNARADDAERAAAWALIRYLADPAQQRLQALEAGLLPVIGSLYEDPEILRQLPVAALLSQPMGARVLVRPATPFYAELSTQISSAFHRVLTGEATGDDVVAALDESLRAIVMRNR